MPTDGWYPLAIDNPAASSTPSHAGVVDKGVLHMTVSRPGSFRPSKSAYFGHQSYPHFTTDIQDGVFKCWQHISIRRAAKALKNEPGGVLTNTEGVVQIEVVGMPGKTDRLHPDPELHALHVAGLAALMRWIEANTSIPRSSTVQGYHQYPPENGHRLGREPWRMSHAEWTSYKGWCAHQHVPENSHGDALFPISELLYKPSPVVTPAPELPATKGLPCMIIVLEPGSDAQWLCTSTTKRHIDAQGRPAWIAAGVPYVDASKSPDKHRAALLARLAEVK